MCVDRQSLRPRQVVLLSIEVTPAALHDADCRVGQQVRQAAAQKIGRRNEVGIEDGDVFAFAASQAISQRAGFITRAPRAAQMLDAVTARLQRLQLSRHQFCCAILRIIQNLNQKPVPRVVESGNGVNQSARDITFVVERQLHRDLRAFFQRRGFNGGAAAAPIAPEQDGLACRVETERERAAGVEGQQ